MAENKPMSQQEFLADAMERMGMTREAFAARIGSTPRTLDKWLLSAESADFQHMPDVAWKFIGEIVGRTVR